MIGLLASSLVGLSVSAGIGSPYDFGGFRADLHVWHVAVSAALGLSGVGLHDEATYGVRNVHLAPALGIRAFSGDGAGFVLAATWAGHRYERSYDSQYAFDSTAWMDIFTLNAGWRFLWSSGWFFEAAGGTGMVIQGGHPSVTGADSIPGPFRRRTWRIVDVVLGGGYHF
ncbi:MAG: hypothetical protein ACJ79H_02620 [Myxococcales bacterium]